MSEENKDQREDKFMEWRFEGNDWIVGIALILGGVLFMLDNLQIVNIDLDNWWAIFILIPGLNMAVNGWRRYTMTGSKASRNSGMWGLVLIMVAFTFFFNLSWSLIFPFLLIAVGIYLLITR